MRLRANLPVSLPWRAAWGAGSRRRRLESILDIFLTKRGKIMKAGIIAINININFILMMMVFDEIDCQESKNSS
jgi:predicted transcriptional regulator